MFIKIRTIFILVLTLLCISQLPVIAAANTVDWNSGYVEATGIGIPPGNLPANSPRATALARRAAIVDAQRNLVEMVQGVKVDSETTVKDLMVQDDSIKTKVTAVIRGARVLNERKLADGSYEVVMRVPLYGVQGIEAVIPEIAKSPSKTSQDNPPTPAPTVKPPVNQVTPFGQTVRVTGKELTGNIYYLPEGTQQLPDFSKLTPVGTIYTNSLDIPARSFEQGFPGVTDRFEWFGIVYAGKFNIDRGGEYTFTIHSDDGTKLFIDGQLVINNDGVHPPQTENGKVSLQPGIHTIRVEYFQGPRYEIALQLFITPPGGQQEIFTIEKYAPASI